MNGTDIFSFGSVPAVIFEDYYLLVIYKPAGFTVEKHPSYASCEDFAHQHLREKFPENKRHFVGIVHRLDANVSGIVIMAKTHAALKNINRQFEQKTVRKIYRAWCENRPSPPKGKIEGWISEDKTARKAFFSKEQKANAKTCSLSYEVLEEKNDSSLVKIELHTGRFHQIRASFAGIGCPIVNDVKYGAKKNSEENSIQLVACELYVKHPKTAEELRFVLAQD